MIVTDMTQKELEQLVLPLSTQAIEDDGRDPNQRVIINISKKDPKTWGQNDQYPVEIKIKGKDFPLDRLKEELFVYADSDRDLKDAAQPSEIFVLIRCDADVRWREVQWVMQACADPAVRIYKLQFATRKVGDN
jgi:biopolymer transport protein ExbD